MFYWSSLERPAPSRGGEKNGESRCSVSRDPRGRRCCAASLLARWRRSRSRCCSVHGRSMVCALELERCVCGSVGPGRCRSTASRPRLTDDKYTLLTAVHHNL